MLAAAIATRDCEPPCTQCGHSDAMREQWGCETDADQPVTVIDCPRCFGEDDRCQRCNGNGTEAVYRCPSKVVSLDEHAACQAAIESEKGIWPEPGAWLDQSPWFISARAVVLSQVERWRESKMKEKQYRG